MDCWYEKRIHAMVTKARALPFMFKGLGYISDVNHVIDIKSSCDRRVLVIGRYVEDGVTPPTELRGLERAP